MEIKKTVSLCPTCLKPVPAEVYEENGKIFIKKTCPEHGEFNNTYWGASDFYGKVQKFSPLIKPADNPQINKDGGCPSNCGICKQHETTTVLGLIDVTNRCNLRCPICFANAAASKTLYEPTFDEIKEMLQNLRNIEPRGCPAIQFAGGEPTVRKDLPELIKLAIDLGFSHTQIATNGIRLAKKEGYAKELRETGLNTVYLQFDGVTEEPYIQARNKNLLPVKLEAIKNCREAGLGIVLVPTLVKGINDDQVGDILKFAMENIDIIHGVNFQPVSFSGRTPHEEVEKQRITIPDFINLVDEQSNHAIIADDFYPPSFVQPISRFAGELQGEEPPVYLNCHEHCGVGTYIFLQGDEVIPVTRFIDVEKLMDLLNQYSDELSEGGFAIQKRVIAKAIKNLPGVIDSNKTPDILDMKKILLDIFKERSYESVGEFHKHALLVSCMHFMDPFNFDADRVRKCIIHYAVPDGRIIPFCTMNSIYRQEVEKEFAIPLKSKLVQYNDKTDKEEEDTEI
jgi:uncharacterized radical SAM superfamily Fe-S cluster-containing enzyme